MKSEKLNLVEKSSFDYNPVSVTLKGKIIAISELTMDKATNTYVCLVTLKDKRYKAECICSQEKIKIFEKELQLNNKAIIKGIFNVNKPTQPIIIEQVKLN